MNRAQQAYYLENAEFVGTNGDFEDLGLGIATATDNYDYSVVSADDDIKVSATQHAATKTTTDATKSYIGGVSISQLNASSTESSSLAILCEAAKAPINGGKQGVAADAENITFSTTAAPVCDGTEYESVGS